MKNVLTLFVLFLGLGVANAQEKKELTNEETVNYLNKKLSEVNEQWIVENNGSRQFIKWLNVKNQDSEISIRDTRENRITNDHTCGDWEKEQSYDFNPTQISEITDSPLKTEQPIGYVQIKLIAKTAKYRMVFKVIETKNDGSNRSCNYWVNKNDDREFYEYIFIPYLKTDPTNFNKIKKAFEHLKKLSASDDPF